MSDSNDCGCPPARELVLCFDGTGNTFGEGGAWSNVLKIFRMTDRNKENRFCYYQPGIGNDITPGSWLSAAISKSPLHKLHDEAHGDSFKKHVVHGYRFLARRWKPGAKVYLFGFSRGAYTARFLNEMLDFVGLISADNEELMDIVWDVFMNWKFAPPGEERDKAEQSLRECRETLCRRIERVHFLGLFDTVNSVDGMDWDYHTSNPIQPNPMTMRHAVSIDERRIKFQPVLFQEIRGRRGETRIPRVSTYAVTPDSPPPDHLSRETIDSNPGFEEVFFSGDHSDVGGGWSGKNWRVSQIPLMWMVQEASLAGLTFQNDQVKQMGCFDPVKHEKYDASIVASATTADLHDSLHYTDPGKTLETMFWRVLECFPFKRPKVAPDGSVQDSRWHTPGLSRPLPSNAKIHSSVINRMKLHPEYRPYNLGVGKRLDIGNWRPVSHHGLCEYFIRIPETESNTTKQYRERERERQRQREATERADEEDRISEEIHRGRAMKHRETV